MPSGTLGKHWMHSSQSPGIRQHFAIREYTEAAERVNSMTLRLAASVHDVKRYIDGLARKNSPR
jgi:hypothetical protein